MRVGRGERIAEVVSAPTTGAAAEAQLQPDLAPITVAHRGALLFSVGRFLRRSAFAVALGSQLLLGALGTMPARAAQLGATPPAQEVVSNGDARALLARSEPQLQLLDQRTLALHRAQADLQMAQLELRQVDRKLQDIRATPASERDDRWGERAIARAQAQRAPLRAQVQQAERALAAALRARDAAAEPLAPAAAGARQILQRLGVGRLPPSLEGPAELLRFAALYETWSARGQGPAREDLEPLAGLARGADTEALLATLAALPVEAHLWAQRLEPMQVDSGAVAYARLLAQRTGYGLQASDLPILTRLSSEDRAALLQGLQSLAERGLELELGNTLHADGDGFRPATDLELVLRLLPAFRGGQGQVAIDPYTVLEISEAQLAAGLQALRGHLQGAIPVDALPLAALIGKGGPPAARALGLLQRASLDRPSAALQLATALVERRLFSDSDAQAFATLDRLGEALGRKPSVAEAASILGFAERAGGLDAVLARVRAVAGDGVELKDTYLLEHAPAELLRASHAELLALARAGLRPGQARISVPYREDGPLESLTRPELIKLLLIQRTLGERAARKDLGALIARDLATENGELGGRLVFDAQGGLRFEAVASPGGNDNAYEMGPSLNPFEAALGFHNHATGGADRRHHAGPSTSYQGTGADLGAAYSRHLDGVVLTPVGRGRVDVDFYTTRGTVVDLGVFDAPW